jgi:hypothetical protein
MPFEDLPGMPTNRAPQTSERLQGFEEGSLLRLSSEGLVGRISVTSATVKSVGARWVAAMAVAAGLALAPAAHAQTFFYTEIAKDGRIFVFASSSRYEAFAKSNGTDLGRVIERPGYGPNGETVVFDGEDSINLYNFKHGLPGEPFPKADDIVRSGFPSGKFSGLMFGDYYWYYDRHQDQISSTDPTVIKGQHGLWFRRIYFAYDLSFSESLTTRFRLEVNSNGEFAGGDLVPYVKDAYLRWTYGGDQRLTLGIHPTLTFDWLDAFWGLRHIEKTPADLYRLDSSRDFGFTFDGPIAKNGLEYAVQFGNESGNGSETQEGKILRFETRYERNPGIALEGFYSFGRRPEGANRQTAQGIGGFRTDAARVGAQYLWQERKSDQEDVADQTIALWSAFAVWEFVPKQANLFFRVDDVTGHAGDVQTGLPDADGIDYWLLSTQSPFTTWIFGGEYFLHPAVRVSPNFELVRYAREPDPTNFPGRRQDSMFRVTFFWTF